MGVASSYAQSFNLLARHQVIDPGLAGRTAAITALRNRIAHGHGTIDAERIWQEAPAGIETLRTYATAIAEYLKGSPDAPRDVWPSFSPALQRSARAYLSRRASSGLALRRIPR